MENAECETDEAHHSGESRNPVVALSFWIPAFARMMMTYFAMYNTLTIALGLVVSLAEHLAILRGGGATFAPSPRHDRRPFRLVCKFGSVGVVTNGAKRAVRFAFSRSAGGLGCMADFFTASSKTRTSSNLVSVEPPRINFKDTFAIFT
jgi:hypothetical protein